MRRFGIFFNNKHSYDSFNLTVADRNIGNPTKIKRKERVPFSNRVYDFSSLYGEPEYQERTLTYVFNLKSYEKIDLSMKRIEVLNWLMNTGGKVMLKDDYVPGFYFLAEVEEAPSFNELIYGGPLTVNFTAYPFKISELEEGNDIWDSFNFTLDYAQQTSFDVMAKKKVIIVNPGSSLAYPKIITSSAMKVKKGSMTYSVPAGSTTSYDFAFSPGVNEIVITGDGSISFHFHKELI